MVRTLLLACASIMIVAAIVGGTDEAFRSSLQGLGVWWNYVFPGLLPFLVLAELMLAFGLVDAAGTMLQPLMRFIFRLPGAGGWAIVQGWTTGFPAGAEAAAALVKRGTLTVREGQRLLAVAHSPNPLFVLVVVGAGFLKQPGLGLYLLLIIWGAGLLTGFVLNRIGRPRLRSGHTGRMPAGASLKGASSTGASAGDSVTAASLPGASSPGSASGAYGTSSHPQAGSAPGPSLLRRAAAAMEEGRRRDGRTFGKALGDSVTASVHKLMSAGGMIIFTAVILSLLRPLCSGPESRLALTAFMESHLGAYAASGWNLPGEALQTAVIAALLAWGGLSALLQAGGAAAGTGLKLLPLAAARLLNAAAAFGLTLALWRPLSAPIRSLLPALPPSPAFAAAGNAASAPLGALASRLIDAGTQSFWPLVPIFFFLFAAFTAMALLLSAAVRLTGAGTRL
ncbi:hypothetical protein [Paenibacillus beijingensis]|uniref:hypothetical protein n=1 Tax=Paenibacillus beijingensis TaxID=1126833 RepID=UPI000696B1BE|nr:hypothetical protein [Paenibacillus beijingensis]